MKIDNFLGLTLKSVLDYGKYKGCTIQEIIEFDSDYLRFLDLTITEEVANYNLKGGFVTKLYYYHSDDCVPCKTFFPIVEKICKELKVEIEKVNIYENESITVTTLPTCEYKGNFIQGCVSEKKFREFINGI